MELPTPVSALIHAATMVTAGIYLFMRMGPLFECCETALLVITWLGGLTSILGAIGSLLMNDMKRVIAYSTISQLGYMAVACGSSQYSIALFHLINHAFFKALLFLSAGAIIHAFKDEQDMRKMGSFGLLLPWTYTFILTGSMSMMAFPFITGFYSKDFLLELMLAPTNSTLSIAYILLMLAAILTATYSTRILILGLIGQPNFAVGALHLITGISLSMKWLLWLPLTILSIGAAIFGFIAHELFLGNAYPLVSLLLPSISTKTYHDLLVNGSIGSIGSILSNNVVDNEGTIFTLGLFGSMLNGQPLIQLFSLLMIFTALPIQKYVNYNSKLKISITNHLAHWNNYNGHQIDNCKTLALMVSRYWDRGLIELIAPLGLLRLFHYSTFKLELLSTGFLPHYSFALLLITLATLLYLSLLILSQIILVTC